MALHLTPEYFEADRRYRQAQTRDEKLAALEDMLRAIPKHKASEKKQSDLKRRISELKSAPAAPKKGAVVDPYQIAPQGAGQALLVGPPNAGKSAIMAARTNAPVKVTDFPYGTAVPVPGIGFHEDVPIQMIDLPPVTPEHLPGGLVNAIRNTNILLLLADLGSPSVLEDTEALLAVLAEHAIEFLPPDTEDAGGHLSTEPHGIIVCNKIDLPGAADTFAVLAELGPKYPPMMAVSATTGDGLDGLLARMFELLNCVRVYAKQPGKPADKDKPFVLPSGATVQELAEMIHKDLAENLKFARVWGTTGHAGQQVHTSHVLHDKDVVELHE